MDQCSTNLKKLRRHCENGEGRNASIQTGGVEGQGTLSQEAFPKSFYRKVDSKNLIKVHEESFCVETASSNWSYNWNCIHPSYYWHHPAL